MKNGFVIEWSGSWFADWEGDPGRTLVRENATVFSTKSAATRKLNEEIKACPHRNFSDAKICPA